MPCSPSLCCSSFGWGQNAALLAWWLVPSWRGTWWRAGQWRSSSRKHPSLGPWNGGEHPPRMLAPRASYQMMLDALGIGGSGMSLCGALLLHPSKANRAGRRTVAGWAGTHQACRLGRVCGRTPALSGGPRALVCRGAVARPGTSAWGMRDFYSTGELPCATHHWPVSSFKDGGGGKSTFCPIRGWKRGDAVVFWCSWVTNPGLCGAKAAPP